MLSLFGNEDSIYISEIHPVPDLQCGEPAKAQHVQPVSFFPLSSFGFLIRMSLLLLFRKRQESHKSQARKSYWLVEMIGGSTLELCLYKQQGDMS